MLHTEARPMADIADLTIALGPLVDIQRNTQA